MAESRQRRAKSKKYVALIYDALRPFELQVYDHSETASQVEPPTIEDVMRLEQAAKLLEGELDKQETKDSNAVIKESLSDIQELEKIRKRSLRPDIPPPEPSAFKPFTIDAMRKKRAKENPSVRFSVSDVQEIEEKNKKSARPSVPPPEPSTTINAQRKKRVKERMTDAPEPEAKNQKSGKPSIPPPEPSAFKPITLNAMSKKQGIESITDVHEPEEEKNKKSSRPEIKSPEPSMFRPSTYDASNKLGLRPVVFNARDLDPFPTRDESIIMAPGMWKIPDLDEPEPVEFEPQVAESIDISISSVPAEQPLMNAIVDDFEKQALKEKSLVPSEDTFGVEFPMLDASDWDRKPSQEKLKEKRQTDEQRRKKRLRHQHFANRITFMLIFVLFFCFRIIHTLFLIQTHEEHLMVVEELFRFGKINCLQVFPTPDDLWGPVIFVYYVSCIFLVILVFSKATKYYYLYFMFIQLFISGLRVWYMPKLYVTKQLDRTVLFFGIRYLAVDLACYTAVMIRFYHAANPAKYRDMYANTLLGDYLINDQIQFLVQPPFIRKKTALKRATAFQTLTVVRKLQERQKASGVAPNEETVNAEVEAAIRSLNDWKKYPTLRIIHDFENRERTAQVKLKSRNKKIEKMKENFKKEVARIKQTRLMSDLESRGAAGVTMEGRSTVHHVPHDVAEFMKGDQVKETSSDESGDFRLSDFIGSLSKTSKDDGAEKKGSNEK